MSRTANPLAASLDAAVEAHHAGVSDADVVLLQEIGTDIAAFAEGLSTKFKRLTSGAMGTANGTGGAMKFEGPAKHAYEMERAGQHRRAAAPVFR